LQHFLDAWDGGKWEEKYKYEECNHSPPYRQVISFRLAKENCVTLFFN
jgi:hypothetical protein